MRIFAYSLFLFLMVSTWSCTSIDDAPPSTRNTFIHLYQGPLNYFAADIIEIEGGYLILGNKIEEDGSQVTLLIQTDEQGNRVGDVHEYPGGTGACIKPFSNADFTGYLIIGSSIEIDPNAGEVADIEIASARILKIKEDFEMANDPIIMISDDVNPTRKTDIKGASLTVTTATNGNVIILITEEAYQSTVKPKVIAYNDDFTIEWEYDFNGLVRDFVSGKSIHHYNGNTLLANSLLRQQGNFNEKYVTITRLKDYLSEDGNAYLGEYLGKSISANDIHPAHSPVFGFGVIGTSSETDGLKKNMFFTKVDALGNLDVPPDSIFIDASLSQTESNLSETEDTGETLSSTSDGGFILAGTMLTSSANGVTIGKGERDIFLVKINVLGAVDWTKLLGGSGDDVVSTIRETEDGGFLICGTNTVGGLGGYSSIFLIKTDKNGELKN